MPTMTTGLVEVTNNGNSRTYRTSAHTVAEPRLVIQKVKYAASVTAVAEDNIRVIFGTSDAAGELLSSRVMFEATVRRPANAVTDDVTSALALFREVIASDEFGAIVATQDWIG